MQKYYVDSGNLQFICVATDEVAAIQKALDYCQDKRLGELIRVNQQGFRRDHLNDVYFSTVSLLNDLGIRYRR